MAMARSPRDAIGGRSPALPVILMQPDDDGSGGGGLSSRRVNNLEDRLMHQERTTQSLIEKAFKIKEDIIESMGLAHGSWQGEKQQRALLQDHIRTITAVVKKLSREIEMIEDRVRARDGNNQNTEGHMKNLEMRQIMSVADLQGRVGRCDSSIAKVSADLRTSFEAMKTLNRQFTTNTDNVVNRLQALEVKVSNLSSNVDNYSMEQSSKIRIVEGDSNVAIDRLSSKTQGLIEDLRNSVTANRAWTESEKIKLEQQLLAVMESHQNYCDARMDKLEQRLEERLNLISNKIDSISNWQHGASKSTHREDDKREMINREKTIHKRIDDMHQRLQTKLDTSKQDCHEGLSSLKESLQTMSNVTEGKRRIMEELLRDEIADLRRLFVLV